jgi:DNA-binding transcriptional ArsR family regulator
MSKFATLAEPNRRAIYDLLLDHEQPVGVIVSSPEIGQPTVADAGRSWWNETTAAPARPIRELRARSEERQSEHELHRALRIADAAEEDAAVAIEIATHWLNVAEYAVIDATLARLAADDLADENVPAQVAGGVS